MRGKLLSRLGMRAFFTIYIMVTLVVVSLVSGVLISLLHNWLHLSDAIPDLFWLLATSIALGGVISTFLGKALFAPIARLGKAMRRVAEGDFSVRLDTEADFKEIRQINADFNLMAKELGATEILQTDFASNVSHEFKTPINAIEGYVTLLQGGNAASGEQVQYIDKILNNTRRLSNLVGNILLLSKVDNRGIQSRRTTYRLDEQIRQSIVSLEPKWVEKGTEFDVELDRVEYTGNEGLLLHVWDNLIDNAIKFGPEQGLIRIRLAQQGGSVTFTVEDEGPGIPPEAQAHIFDRFYQADSSRKDEGNGLGLALVKEILKVENGSVSVKNILGGCQFTVCLRLEESLL